MDLLQHLFFLWNWSDSAVWTYLVCKVWVFGMELISYAAIHNMFQRSSFVLQRVARLCEGFWLSWSIKICASLCHWQCFISRLETWPWTSKAAARSGYDPWSADNWKILIVTIQASAASPPEILLGEETVALGVVHAEGVLKHCVVLQGNLLLLLRSNYSFLLDWRLSSVINMIYSIRRLSRSRTPLAEKIR